MMEVISVEEGEHELGDEEALVDSTLGRYVTRKEDVKEWGLMGMGRWSE